MRRALGVTAALALAVGTASTATATPPGLNGIFALDGVTGTGNIHSTPSTPGGSLTRLTFDAAQENDAAWSPDGRKIAFTSRRDGGDAEIYIMNADGSDQVRFTVSTGVDEQPAWSPDGARLAWASDRAGNLDIFSANLNGTDLRQHTLNAAIPDTEPDWSPDGSAIAFTSNRSGSGDIYRLSPTGTEVGVLRLTSDATSEGHPTWSPDGSRVAFDSARGGDTNVWSVNSDGAAPEAGLRQHTANASGDQEPAWSPDGTRIAFSSLRAGANWDIWTVAASGPAESSPLQITSNGGSVNEFQPAWQSVAPAPALASLSPGGVVSGSPDVAVIVDGSNFVRRSQVRWNGQPRSTQFVSSTRLTFVVPAADVAQPGSARVTVHTTPVGGGESAALQFAVNPGIVLTKALLQPRWSASRLVGRLDLRGVVGRPAVLEARVLRASGKGKALVTRRFQVKQAGSFTQRLRLLPTLLPGRYLVRVTEVAGTLPAAQRAAKLSAPREGVVSRAFFSTKIGGRPLARIAGRSIIFAHFRYAAKPKAGKRLTVRWFSPGAKRAVAVDRKPISSLVIAFIKSSGPLPRGTWRAELRYGRTLVATARTRLG